jgi:hypothetical protein
VREPQPKFAAFGLRIPAFDPGGYFGAILSQPSILFMEHLNHLSDESPADW